MRTRGLLRTNYAGTSRTCAAWSCGSSLEAIPEILEASPGTQIAVLTMQDEPALARQALGAGAKAYVPKEAVDDELVTAVRRAARQHGAHAS